MVSLFVRAGCAVLVVLLLACSPNLPIPENVVVTCQTSADCPDGFVCTNGSLCVPSTRSDTVAPTVTAAAYDKPAVTHGATVTLSFTVSESLLVDPVLTFVSGGAQYTMTRTARDLSALTYAYSYTATGSEAEGSWVVSAALLDEAGNANNQTLQAFSIDFTAPGILQGSAVLTLTPDRATNPLSQVTAITSGTHLQLAIATNEPLATAPTVALDGAATAIGTMTLGSVTVATLELDWNASLGIADGTHDVHVTLTDLAGNSAAVLLAGVTFVVDTVAPAPPLVGTSGAIVLSRAPWGDNGAPGQASHLDGAAGSVEGNTTVLAYDTTPIQPCASSTSCNFATFARGRVPAAADGSFNIDFGPSDRQFVYLAVADAAGNVSGRSLPQDPLVPVVVRDAVLTATTALSQATVSQNGTQLTGVEVFANALPHTAGDPAGRTDVASEDGTTFGTAGRAAWTVYLEPSVSFDGRFGVAMGYLPTTGQVVTFGGAINTGGMNYLDDDSVNIRDTSTFRSASFGATPSPRHGAALAYDVVNDGLLLYGGADDGTWLWTGTAWMPLCVGSCADAGPGVVSSAILVSDPTRHVVVLLNETSDQLVWEWDGVTWHSACDAGCAASGPPAAVGIGATFDENLGETFVMGGVNGEMWSWNGSRWLARCTTAPCTSNKPPPRLAPQLAYDVAHGNVVLFGGVIPGDLAGSLVDTWTWNGSTWTPKPTTVQPTRRYGAAMAYDASRQRVVMLGGTVTFTVVAGETDALWEWDGSKWREWRAVGTPNTSPTTTFDPQSNMVLAVAGGSTLLWDGWAWLNSGITATPGVSGWAATPASGTRKPVYVCSGGTYTLQGSAWAQTCAGACGLTAFGRVATDGSGIIITGQTTNDTWRWNGSSWSAACTGCTAHSLAGLSYGGQAGSVVSVTQGPAFETFSAGTWSTMAVTSNYDALYNQTAIAYDSGRKAFAVLPGNFLGLPGAGHGRQSLQEVLGGVSRTSPLAVSSDAHISGPAHVANLAYDEAHAQMIAMNDTPQTGAWRSGGTTSPAHLFAIGLVGAVVPSDVHISAIDIAWTGTASSKLGGSASSGISFAVWSIDRWRPVPATAVDATHWTAHLDDATLGSPYALDDIVVGPNAQVTVAIMPAGTNADLVNYASITTDFVRGRVTYARR